MFDKKRSSVRHVVYVMPKSEERLLAGRVVCVMSRPEERSSAKHVVCVAPKSEKRFYGSRCLLRFIPFTFEAKGPSTLFPPRAVDVPPARLYNLRGYAWVRMGTGGYRWGKCRTVRPTLAITRHLA